MSEYFSHDYDAREDEKIIDLMGELGWAGYGQYWGIIEILYKNNGKMRTQYERIAFALNSHPDSIKIIIENFRLFQVKNGFFFSKSVNSRLKKREVKSNQARYAANERWKNKDADAMQTQSGRNAKKDSILKDSKIKDSKEYKEFIELFNSITGKKCRGTSKDKTAFNARMKDGYSLDDFNKAITNCMNDKYHKDNPQYLTPEFITRADKLEKYLNITVPYRPY